MTSIRIGIDFGGSKIEIIALGPDNQALLRRRVANPRDYHGALDTVRTLVHGAEAELGTRCSVGAGIPGAISPATGLVLNANSVWMNGRPFDRDLAAVARDLDTGLISRGAAEAAYGVVIAETVALGDRHRYVLDEAASASRRREQKQK